MHKNVYILVIRIIYALVSPNRTKYCCCPVSTDLNIIKNNILFIYYIKCHRSYSYKSVIDSWVVVTRTDTDGAKAKADTTGYG